MDLKVLGNWFEYVELERRIVNVQGKFCFQNRKSQSFTAITYSSLKDFLYTYNQKIVKDSLFKKQIWI